MTIAEILKAKGLDAETIAQITEEMKTNKIFTASEENMDIRYGKLKTQSEGTSKQLDEANALIEELKKSTKGQEETQQKITAYEQQVAQLQTELNETRLNAAVKVALLSEKAADVDYLTYKLNAKLKADGESLTLDENGAIKGWGDKLEGLKLQFPTMFESGGSDNGGYQVLEPNKLKGSDSNEAMSKAELLKKPYAEREQIFRENPEAFRTAFAE